MLKIFDYNGNEVKRERFDGFMLCIETMRVYKRGRNVSDKYYVEIQYGETQFEKSKSQVLESQIRQLITKLDKMNNGSTKAYLKILQKTTLAGFKSRIIENEYFTKAGRGVSRRDHITAACDMLSKQGLISKQEIDTFEYEYSILGGADEWPS